MTLINVILGGKTVYEGDVPSVIGGEMTQMDTKDLSHREINIDNDIEKTTVTEYWLDGELVHRSVYMHLKTGIFCIPEQAEIGA